MKTVPIKDEMRSAVLAALAESPWFRALQQRATADPAQSRELEHLVALADLREYAPGETIIRQGYPSDSFYVLVRGTVSVRLGEGGATEVGGFGPPGSFGEVGLLLDEPRTATVVAQESVLALRLSAAAFSELVQKVPEFGIDTSRHLARRLYALTSRFPLPESPLARPAEDEEEESVPPSPRPESPPPTGTVVLDPDAED